MKFHKIISKHYDEMNIRNFKIEEHTSSKYAQSISKIYHRVLILLVRILQIKPQVKNMNTIYYDLYYTPIKNRDEKEIISNKYEDNEIDYTNFNDSYNS